MLVNLCICDGGGGSYNNTITTNPVNQTQPDNNATSSTSQEVYKQTVDADVAQRLSISGFTPATNGVNYLFGKRYTEDNFTCQKQDKLFGAYAIVKEQNVGLCESFINCLTDVRAEKIIEEYDKNGNKTRQTYYHKDGSYTVTRYKSDGSIDNEAHVRSYETDDMGYETEIKITTYCSNGSYNIQTITYSMDDSCTDGKSQSTYNIDYYNKDGSIDIASTLIGSMLQSALGI